MPNVPFLYEELKDSLRGFFSISAQSLHGRLDPVPTGLYGPVLSEHLESTDSDYSQKKIKTTVITAHSGCRLTGREPPAVLRPETIVLERIPQKIITRWDKNTVQETHYG